MQKFNVGDKVKVVKLDNRTWVEVSKRLGQIGTVIKPDPTDCQIEFEDGKRFFFHYHELQKVEEKFKIGEEVYINYSYYKNTFAKIVSIDGSYIEVIFELSIYPTRGYTFHKDYISKQPINPDNQVEKIMTKTPEQIDKEIIDLKAQITKLEKEKEDRNFEVGDWFKVDENSSCGDFKRGCFYEIVKIDKESYATMLTPRFNESGDGKNNRYNSKFAIKATPAEIEAHLIKLAEELGLKIGGKVPNKSYNIEGFKICNGFDSSYSCEEYTTQNKLKYCLKIIYNNDNSAVPFDYISHLSQKFQPKITINGYDAEFYVGYVKFGCAKFDNEIFRKSKELIDYTRGLSPSKNSNRTIANITIGQGVFTPTDIDNIVKRLKS